MCAACSVQARHGDRAPPVADTRMRGVVFVLGANRMTPLAFHVPPEPPHSLEPAPWATAIEVEPLRLPSAKNAIRPSIRRPEWIHERRRCRQPAAPAVVASDRSQRRLAHRHPQQRTQSGDRRAKAQTTRGRRWQRHDLGARFRRRGWAFHADGAARVRQRQVPQARRRQAAIHANRLVAPMIRGRRPRRCGRLERTFKCERTSPMACRAAWASF